MRDNLDNIEKNLKHNIEQKKIDLLERLKAEPVEKMKEHDDITRQVIVKKAIPLYRRVSQFAAAVIFIIFAGIYSYNNFILHDIFIDINPSFNIRVSNNDKVKEINALNKDAEKVLNGFNFKNIKYDEAIKVLIERVKANGYLSGDAKFVLVSSKESDKIIRDIIASDIKTIDKDISILKSRADANTNESGYEQLVDEMVKNENIIDKNKFLNMTIYDFVKYLKRNNIDIEKYIESDEALKIFDEETLDDIEDVIEEDDDNDEEDFKEKKEKEKRKVILKSTPNKNTKKIEKRNEVKEDYKENENDDEDDDDDDDDDFDDDSDDDDDNNDDDDFDYEDSEDDDDED